MADDIAGQFAHRVHLFRAHDNEKLEWLDVGTTQRENAKCPSLELTFFEQAFHHQLAELSRKYKDSCSDLERERIAGRATQDRVRELERHFQELKQSIVCSLCSLCENSALTCTGQWLVYLSLDRC